VHSIFRIFNSVLRVVMLPGGFWKGGHLVLSKRSEVVAYVCAIINRQARKDINENQEIRLVRQ
jgi:hypothetical protein